MKLPSPKRSEKIDRWLIGFSLIGILFFFYFLYDDSWIHTSDQTSIRTKIGSISMLDRDVRRKSSDGFIWLPLNELESVFLGDSIFTGSKSTAVVQLDSGVKLWIDSDSMVVLNQSSDSTKLDLRFGNVRGSLGKKSSTVLKLNINNQDLDLEGKSVEFFLEKNKKSEANLRVTDGTAKVTETKSKKQISLPKRHSIKIDREVASIGKLTNIAEEIFFVRPEQWAVNRNIWLPKKQTIKLLWQAEGPIAHFEIIISKKADLSRPLVQEISKLNGFEWLPPFDEGTIYWRIKAFKKDQSQEPTISDTIQWNIGLLTAPEWIDINNPVTFAVAELKEKNEKGGPLPRLIKWKSNIKSNVFRLEWSRDVEFKEGTKSLLLKDKKWELPSWEAGRYFIRVRSESLGRPASLWSYPLVVAVSEKDPEGLEAPEWLTLEKETLQQKQLLSVEWKPQIPAVEYRLQISNQADFSRLLYNEKVQAHSSAKGAKPLSWQVPGQEAGTYFVRLFPFSKTGRRGPVSKTLIWYSRWPSPVWLLNKRAALTRHLIITIPRDEKDKLLDFPETLLQWKDRTETQVKEYVFEQDSSSDFLNVKAQRIKEPKGMLKNLKPGVYFYRVKSVFKDDSVSLASLPLKVEVLEQPADGLTPPVMLSYKLISVLEGDKPAMTRLQWEKSETAAQFRVELAQDNNFQKLIAEHTVPSNESEISIDKSGEFYFRVAGISKNSRVGPWSEPIQWKVNLAPPVITPMEPLVLNLIDSSRTLATFAPGEKPYGTAVIHWAAPQLMKNFQLEIFEEDKNGSKPFLNETVQNREFKIQLFNTGIYKIMMKGLDEKGRGITAYSKPEILKFTVKRPLQTPYLVNPSNKVSYILSKRDNPPLWLEWKGDKLARLYQVEMARDVDFKNILRTLNVKENRLQLNHQSLRGNLFWRVKALNEEQNLESPWSSAWSFSVVFIENED